MTEREREYERWRKWVSVCVKAQEPWRENAERWLGLYEGRSEKGNASANSRYCISVNRVFPTTEAMVAALYARNPRVRVLPRREKYRTTDGRELDGVEAAKTIERIVNWQFGEMGVDEEVRLVIRDAFLFGYGAMYVGYQAQVDTVRVTVEEGAEEVRRTVNPEYVSWMKSESVVYRWLRPSDVLFPPTASRLKELPFLIVREVRHLDEVLADPNVLEGAKRKLRERGGDAFQGSVIDGYGQEKSEDYYGQKVGEEMRESFNMVTCWNIWSRKENFHGVIAEGCDEFLRHGPWPFDLEGYPVEFLVFNEHPRSIYPISDVETYEDQARELEIIRNRMLDAVDKVKQIILVTKGRASEEDLSRIAKAAQGGIVEVQDSAAFNVVQLSSLPQELFQFEGRLQEDMLVQSQVSEYRQGVRGEAKTATEAQLIAQGTSVKLVKKNDLLLKFIRNVARKTLQILQENLTARQALRIEGDKGFTFLEYGREDIEGEYDFEVEADSNHPTSFIVEQQRALEALNLMYGKQGVDNVQLLRETARKLRMEKIGEIIPGPDNPDAAGNAEFENRLMLAGEPQQVLPNHLHEEHVRVHQAALGVLQGEINRVAAETEDFTARLAAERAGSELQAAFGGNGNGNGMSAAISAGARMSEANARQQTLRLQQVAKILMEHIMAHQQYIRSTGSSIVPGSDFEARPPFGSLLPVEQQRGPLQ